jgi:hypothetical protein
MIIITIKFVESKWISENGYEDNEKIDYISKTKEDQNIYDK